MRFLKKVKARKRKEIKPLLVDGKPVGNFVFVKTKHGFVVAPPKKLKIKKGS